MSIIWVGSGRFGAAAYDTDAQAYIAAVEAADGQALEAATRDAINQLVLTFKAGNIWTNAVQIILPCGPRTLASSAGLALKGPNPTNGTGSAGPSQFTSGNYNRKTGLGNTSNTGQWLNSNVAQNSLPATSHAIGVYGNITTNSGDRTIAGCFNDSTNLETSLSSLDAWASYISGRAFRSGAYTSAPTRNFPVSTSTASASCLIGSRTSAANAVLYVDGTASTNSVSATPSFSARSMAWFAMRQQTVEASTFCRDILQVGAFWSSGLDATQADAFRSACATYVAAIAAAF